MPAKNPAHTFTEKETKLAETIASQIAAAVDNARLYGQTEMALDTAKRDLEIGHEIQSGFFPEVVPQIPGWDIAAYFQGARQVAGDFYDVFQFKNSPFTAFVIADVCDKGVGAALFMVLFRSLLRAFSDEPVRGANIPERLKEIVLKTNIFIAEYHGQSNMFATMFFGILDPDSDTLYYINGGHEPPIMMDKEGKVTQRIRPTGPAVGLFSDMSFTVEEIQFNKGDILVSFTDGVPDAIDDARELFSEKRLLKSIQAPWTSAFSMLYELNADLQKHIGEQAQFDDVTLLSLRRKHTLKIDHHAICRIADTKALSELREFAERAAIECNLSHDIVFAFKLATEEICTNIIQYGYEGENSGLISLAFECGDRSAILTIKDDGRYFSPDQAEAPDLGENWEERKIGGLGIHFVKELMDHVSYSRDEKNTNTLILEKILEPTEE
jgi:serine phosphatase RsbU (regulator of sigma subunit)/anti-sigma regulatory factor (Ser/Thr protein kinase)